MPAPSSPYLGRRCVPGLSPRGQLRHGAVRQTIPAPRQGPSGCGALSREGQALGREGRARSPRSGLPGVREGVRPPPRPAPPSPAGPPRPGTKHTAPILSAFVAIWQIHVDTANIHLFRHIMSRNREQLELCLLLLLMRMGDREREREKKKKSFNYKRYPANYEPYVPIVSKQSNEVHFKSRLLY